MSSEYDDLIMLAERRELESALAKAWRERDEVRRAVTSACPSSSALRSFSLSALS